MLPNPIFPTLRRPRTLVRAARFAMSDYRRERHTKRLLKLEKLSAPTALIPKLADLELEMETMRKEGDACYSVAKHIIVLAALLTELSLVSSRSI